MRSSSKTEPKNEGRQFRAWCGGIYLFRRDREGKLYVKPLEHNYIWVDGLSELWQKLQDDVAKAETFHQRYSR